MRRIALLAAGMAALLFSTPAQAEELTDQCRSTEAALLLQGPCRGAEQLTSAAAAHCRYATAADGTCQYVPLTPRVVRAEIDDYRASWQHHVLADQYERGSSLPMIDAPWVGTHNSFNSVRQAPALSETDANQQLSLVDQLRLDVRSLELDLHSFLGKPVVCHGQGTGLGCTTERPLVRVIDSIRPWLADHRDQVLLLYLEDHLHPKHERQAMSEILRRLRVLSAQDADLATLTREDVLAAGRQIVLVGGPGSTESWRRHVFQWNPIEWEDRPRGFSGCANAGAQTPPYASRIVRFYEDSTWLTQQAEVIGQSSTDDGLRPDTVRAMVECGVDLLGFDQVVPDDPRWPALVWSWAENHEPGPCAYMRYDGRWVQPFVACEGERRVACFDGGWFVPDVAVALPDAEAACTSRGGEFRAPRTGAENAALRAVAPPEVWIGV